MAKRKEAWKGARFSQKNFSRIQGFIFILSCVFYTQDFFSTIDSNLGRSVIFKIGSERFPVRWKTQEMNGFDEIREHMVALFLFPDWRQLIVVVWNPCN